MVAPITISHLSQSARVNALRSIAVVEATERRNFWIVVLGRTPSGFARVAGLAFDQFVAEIERQLKMAAWTEYADQKYAFRSNGSLLF